MNTTTKDEKNKYTTPSKYGLLTWCSELKPRKNEPVTRAIKFIDDELSYFQNNTSDIKNHIQNNKDAIFKAIDDLSQSYNKDDLKYNILKVFGFPITSHDYDLITQLKIWFLNAKEKRTLNAFLLAYKQHKDNNADIKHLESELLKDDEVKQKHDELLDALKPKHEPTPTITYKTTCDF